MGNNPERSKRDNWRFFQNGIINTSRGHVGILRQVLIDKALIILNHIRLRTVIGDKDFSMLIGIHCAWINVEIWIEFLHRYPDAPAFEETA